MNASSKSALAWSSLEELSALIRAKEVSPVDVTSAMLERISGVNPSLNCYLTVVADSALKQAEALEKLLLSGVYLGPLHGVPVAVKDNIDTVGVRTTIGSRIFSARIPSRDATVVQRLKANGAILLGKTSMYEFAFGSWHPDYGETLNPWDQNRSCSGSSGGSACAVAAGLAYGSVGTDTGGSVRLPAALCGVVGLKPTYGLISRAGVFPVSWSLDHVGIFGRTAIDVSMEMAAVTGYDPQDETSVEVDSSRVMRSIIPDAQGICIGVPKAQANEIVDLEVREAIDAALRVLEGQGAKLLEVDLPNYLLSRSAMWIISSAEVAENHRRFMRQRAHDYGKVTRAWILNGEFIPATDYVHAQRVRHVIRTAYKEVMERVDVLVMPATPIPAYEVGTKEVDISGRVEDLWLALSRYNPICNLTGQPSVSVPCGFNRKGLPLAFQLIGRDFGDWTVLRVATAYQTVTAWHQMHPPALT